MNRVLAALWRRTRDLYDQRIRPLSRRERLGICLLLVACFAVAVKAMLVPPLDDPWAYSLWYIEEWLLSHGFHLPTCGYVSSVGNYDPYWGKICVDIDTPAAAYLSSGLTALTGLDFVHRWTRFFLLTPLAKFVVGYLLASLYTDDTRYRTLCAAAVFLVPDYSPLYITEARGLSFDHPLRVLRDDSLEPRGGSLVLGWRGHPRAHVDVLSPPVAVVAPVRVRHRRTSLATRRVTVERRPRDGRRPADSLALHGDRLSQSNGEFTGFDFHNTLGVIGSRFGFGTTRPVPFLLSWPPYVMLVLAPVALVSAVSALRALSREGSEFLLDGRMLLAVQRPRGVRPRRSFGEFFLDANFLRGLDSRPARRARGTRFALVPCDGDCWNPARRVSSVPRLFSRVSRLSRTRIPDLSRERVARVAHATGYLLIALMVVGNLLVIPGVWTFPYRGNYDGLVNGMHRNGVERGDPIFTELKTGAYLVGMDGYETVYRNSDDYDRKALVDVWYGTNATAACTEMRSYHSDYFVLSRDVSTDVLYVENYERKPINRSAYLKFDRSPLFTPVVQRPEFTVYRIDRDCRPPLSQRFVPTSSA